MQRHLAALCRRAGEPIDSASLRAFRCAFGLLMLVGVVRFFAHGWVASLYVEPTMHFSYPGFAWLQPWAGWGMYVHFAVLGALALLVALGVAYRAAIVGFAIAFTYVELLDRTNYLNHYYLVTILAVMLAFMPLGRGTTSAPRWCLWALRLQVGLVYFFAGVAKLRADWLFEAQPLTTWFAARGDIPVLGVVLGLPYAPLVASWLGALFDLSFPWLMSWRRARPYAFAACIVFHAFTGVMFNLGMFPWIMLACATLFFDPAWPRRYVRALPVDGTHSPLPRWGIALLACHFALQIALPLRKHLHEGDVAWTENGVDFAWHVMLREKAGIVWFHVTDPESGRRWVIRPDRYLTPRQTKMMATSPDMIAEMARRIAADFRSEGTHVEVRAEAYVALHGRPSRSLLDPDTNLAP